MALCVSKLPGNKYLNGIIFGCGEVFAMFLSQCLMNNLKDIKGFWVVYALTAISFLCLIFLSEGSSMISYLANILFITGNGGWINIQLLILELRVPH